MIQSRLSNIDEESRHLLQLAAVIGRAFDLDFLRCAADRGQAGIFRTLEPLIASGLIVETPAEEYYFSHDKFRQSLYDGLSGLRRRALHLRVAQALEENGEKPLELAHHYLQARAWRPALENLVQAAQSAVEEYAWETALRSYARALDVVEKLPGSGDEKRFELLVARDGVLERMGRREERAAALQEMFDLARHLGDCYRIAEAHMRRMRALATLPNLTGAAQSGRAAITLFRELEDKSGEARAHREMGYVSWMNRDHASALEANFRAWELHRETGDRLGEAGDAGNVAQVYRSMGDQEEALRWIEEATQVYAGLGDETDEILRIDTMAYLHRHGAEITGMIPLSLKSLQVLTDFGVEDFFFSQQHSRGTLYLDIGAPEEAVEQFRTAAYFDRKR